MAQLSVCIPAYEQPHAMRRALTSLWEQTWKDFEVIVTDDSTGDDVEQVVRAFEHRLPIRYWRNRPRLGATDNWNFAVQCCSTDLVKMLHHDDWLSGPDALYQFARLLRGGAKFGFSARHTCAYPIGQVLRTVTTGNVPALRRRPYRLLKHNDLGVPSQTIFHRSLKARFDPRFTWAADVEFYARAIKEAGDLVYSPEPLVKVMLGNPGQLTTHCLRDRSMRLREHVLSFRSAAGNGDFAWAISYFRWVIRELKVSEEDLQDLRAPLLMRALIPIEQLRRRRKEGKQ